MSDKTTNAYVEIVVVDAEDNMRPLGTKRVKAREVRGPWAVTPRKHSGRKDSDGPGAWTVTHTPSGYAAYVGVTMRQARAAIDGLEAIGGWDIESLPALARHIASHRADLAALRATLIPAKDGIS